MIDLHSHFLPALDDGAADLADSQLLLELAVKDGIRRMVATPHINPGYFDNTQQSIAQGLALVRRLIAEQQLPIQIAAGAEVRLTDRLMSAIEQNEVPFIGKWQGQRVLLLELPHSHVPAGTDVLLRWLARQDIIAMIAHPERNRDIQMDPSLLNPLKRVGCLFQLTGSSLLGDLGARHQRCAEDFVKQRLYHICASDCHSAERRPPKLSDAKRHIAALTDEQYAALLVDTNPELISASLDFVG